VCVISIRRISLGGGFRYLMESVAAGDGAPERSGGLSRYYASSGTPPGVWVGAGLADLGDGIGVPAGEVVAEEQLRAMLGELTDPLSGVSRAGARSVPGARLLVAGFDLTFSPPKSVSVAWALADEGTKAVIYACHREAIETVLAWAEGEVFHSRSGAGGIVEEDIGGVVGASFTHWASRADDPQLHDHLVVWNRARSLADGRWRTLDSRAIFKATTTLSELHQGVLSDLLTDALGVGWDARGRRHSTRPRYEIAGVGEALMAEFSQRAEAIDAHQRSGIEAFVTAHGRAPSAVEQMRIRQTSTLATRPDKSHRSLAELTACWRQRADGHVPVDAQVAFVASLSGRNDLPRLRADDLDDAILADAARAAVDAVADRHATYSRMNLFAEAHRLIHGVRFAAPAERIAVAERIGVLALEASTLLTPPPARHVPAVLRRRDGSSRLAPPSRMLYTTEALLDAEARLLTADRDHTGPTVDFEAVLAVTGVDLPGREVRLSVDQAVAVAAVATSGRRLDVLVGPAGTGKSTAMAGLRAAWEQAHGAGSVTGSLPRPSPPRSSATSSVSPPTTPPNGSANGDGSPTWSLNATGSPPASTTGSIPARPPPVASPARLPTSTSGSSPAGSGRASWSSSTRPPWPGPSPSTSSSLPPARPTPRFSSSATPPSCPRSLREEPSACSSRSGAATPSPS